MQSMDLVQKTTAFDWQHKKDVKNQVCERVLLNMPFPGRVSGDARCLAPLRSSCQGNMDPSSFESAIYNLENTIFFSSMRFWEEGNLR